jgi:hypothetical protein
MCPGTQSGVDRVMITVRDVQGDPISGSSVEIDVSGCGSLCVPSPDNGLTGTTDVGGLVTLDPRVGGCEDCTIVVRADGFTLRTYTRVTSTDWDGNQADGVVDQSDSTFFANNFNAVDPCTDYNGNQAADASDAVRFTESFTDGDVDPDPSRSSVEPWDTFSQAFMCPGTQSGVDEVTIIVASSCGVRLAEAQVEIDVSACNDLCVDSPSGLSGMTDGNGELTLDPRVGGCEDCTIIVRAAGLVLRNYSRVTSTDWDGNLANGIVEPTDQLFFNNNFNSVHPCTDYNGSGTADLPDAVRFSQSIMNGDRNVRLCAASAVGDGQPVGSTRGIELFAIRPNPFTASARITFQAARDMANVRVAVYDIAGRMVWSKNLGSVPAGAGSMIWDGTDSRGVLVSAGNYFLRIEHDQERSKPARVTVTR